MSFIDLDAVEVCFPALEARLTELFNGKPDLTAGDLHFVAFESADS